MLDFAKKKKDFKVAVLKASKEVMKNLAGNLET